VFRGSTWLWALALFAQPASTVWEVRTAAAAGIGYRHDNGLTPRRRLPENMGPGVAIFDYDSDGRMDVAFPTALYRNVGGGRFEDVTRAAGIDTKLFGIGVAVGDPDRDGDCDLVVTAWGAVWLYENQGGKGFRKQKIANEGLWTAAVFFDADQDGWDDLYLGHFVDYSEAKEPECKYGGNFHYCHPMSYAPHGSVLLRNVEGKAWKDVSAESGIGKHLGKAFGAVAADVNGDGRLDLFVANDSVANFLFLNRGGMRFEEKGLEANVAYSSDGNPRSGMGVDAADYDGDGREDLFVANFNRERFSIYRNLGGAEPEFRDEAGATGIGSATQMYSGWGVKFLDADHDSRLDLLVVNGHPDDRIENLSTTLAHKEPILFFTGGPKYTVTRAGGSYPARGLAIGDLDNDGHYDAVVANNGEAPVLLRSKAAGSWVGLNFASRPVGAVLRWKAGGKEHRRAVNSDGSYLSANDPRVLLGLGEAVAADWVEIEWRGQKRRLDRLAGGRYHAVPQF
jgi:enediyne biosynthesis protein E4